MVSKKRILFHIATVGLFLMCGNFAHPITPTLIVERNLDPSMFGVAMAGLSVTTFLFSPFWGTLCSYLPTRVIMAISAFGYAIGQAIFGCAVNEVMIVGGRMISGVFAGGLFTSYANYIINVTPDPKERSQYLTMMLTTQTVGSAIGYFIGGMLGVISIWAAVVPQVAVAILCAVLHFVICIDDTPYKAKPQKALSLRDANPFSSFASAKKFTTPLLAMIFAVTAVAAIGQTSYEQCFNYVIKDEFGLSSAYNGTFKAAIAVLTVLVNSTICVYLQKKTDINITFLPVFVSGALLLGAAVFLRGSLIPFAAVYILWNAVNALRGPLVQSIVAGRAASEHSNQVMGFYQAMNSLGGIFGALFAGLIYESGHSYPFILAFAAFSVASLIGVGYIRMYKRER
ncbi:MAG: MFS transporter [Clostridia bacterium]|nr:MFS transporter [Clostridia bacterium]MBQ2327427.1 MFS transporter [Clostridia bacterium]MBQ5813620.1 MFS transporter [Clostridia bacterium]